MLHEIGNECIVVCLCTIEHSSKVLFLLTSNKNKSVHNTKNSQKLPGSGDGADQSRVEP